MSSESLDICDAVALTSDGTLDCAALAEDYIKRIEQHEPEIQAWAWFKPDLVRKQAGALDDLRRSGKPTGALHGMPIGIKDIIDTALIPTEYGSELFQGRLPKSDAVLVERLKAAGAIILGKTVTAKLATFMPGKTTNPHNPAHTPGGSSSGSAAAVAAFMAAGAVGTQTNGSVIRPASYCGTVGYKPTYGLIPRTGILTQSPFLDQAGVFTRSVRDAALLAEVMMGGDPGDKASLDYQAMPALHKTCISETPLPPKFGMVKTAVWDQADQTVQDGFEELQEALGQQIELVDLPENFNYAWDHLKTVNEAEMAAWYQAFYERGPEYFDDVVSGQMERGRKTSAPDYIAAMEFRAQLNAILGSIFSNYDALITPAAAGPAPAGLDHTGSPAFCSTWTFCGVPAVTLPLLSSEENMPVGIQLVGAHLDDGRLLRSARWLSEHLAENGPETGT